MKPQRCPECHRCIEPGDERWKFVRATRDCPAHDTEACKHCAPTSEDLERLRDAHLDRLEAEARDQGWAV